jgi:hypothetical protein
MSNLYEGWGPAKVKLDGRSEEYLFPGYRGCPGGKCDVRRELTVGSVLIEGEGRRLLESEVSGERVDLEDVEAVKSSDSVWTRARTRVVRWMTLIGEGMAVCDEIYGPFRNFPGA